MCRHFKRVQKRPQPVTLVSRTQQNKLGRCSKQVGQVLRNQEFKSEEGMRRGRGRQREGRMAPDQPDQNQPTEAASRQQQQQQQQTCHSQAKGREGDTASPFLSSALETRHTNEQPEIHRAPLLHAGAQSGNHKWQQTEDRSLVQRLNKSINHYELGPSIAPGPQVRSNSVRLIPADACDA